MVPVNRAGREKLSEVLAYELGINYSSVLRMLHREVMRDCGNADGSA
jgi:hypothetical protein